MKTMKKNSSGMIGFVAIRIVILILFIAALLVNQTRVFAQNGYPVLTNFVVTRPQAIPTGATDVIKQDAYVCYADFTATGQTITVQDRQTTPVTWLNAFTLAAAASPWSFSASSERCRFMPNGITIQAGGAGVTGVMIIGCPKRCALTWGF